MLYIFEHKRDKGTVDELSVFDRHVVCFLKVFGWLYSISVFNIFSVVIQSNIEPTFRITSVLTFT